MKLIKNGFAAIIAILAVGMTIAASAGTSKEALRTNYTNCYTNIAYVLDPEDECVFVPIEPQCLTAESREGLGIDGSLIGAPPSFVVCDDQTTVFCCATLEATARVCPDQAIVTHSQAKAFDGSSLTNLYAKIKEVECKSGL